MPRCDACSQDAESVACPKCHAPEGTACDMLINKQRIKKLKRPHRARTKLTRKLDARERKLGDILMEAVSKICG